MFSTLLPPHKDPAERGYLRLFYQGWRPTRFGRLWSRAVAWVAGLGLAPRILLTLQVKDRSTDCLHDIILVVARYQGQRYLVSMLGNGSEWVQNVRAAGGKACIKRCWSRRFCLGRFRLRSAHQSSKPGVRLRQVVASTFRSHLRHRWTTSKPSQTTTQCFASTMKRFDLL